MHKYSKAIITNDGWVDDGSGDGIEKTAPVSKDDKFPIWGIVLILIIVLLVLGILAYYGYRKYRDRKLENQLVDEYGKLDGTRR